MTRKEFMEEVMTPNEDGTVPSMEGYILANEPGQQCEMYENFSRADLAIEFRARGGSFITAEDIDNMNSFPIGTEFIVHAPYTGHELGFFRDQEKVRVKSYSDIGMAVLESLDRAPYTGFLMERESLSRP